MLKSKSIKYNIVQLENHYTELLDKEIETLSKSITIDEQVEHQYHMKLELLFWKINSN